MFRSGEQLSERALHMRKAGCAAEKADVPAQIGFARQTVVAGQAGSGRIHRDALTDPNLCHISPHFNDFSSHFVAEHHRFTQSKVAYTPSVIVMQVGSANPAGAKPN